MNKLLRAAFARLRKNKLFWILTIFSIALALFMVYTCYSDKKTYGTVIEVEQIMLNYSTLIGIVIAIFTSLFLGVEYSDGVIRNKISAGHKRPHIYLANLLITAAASLFSYVLFMISAAVIGIPLFGGITIPIQKLLVSLGCIFAAILAYSSIFTFAAMLIDHKAVAAIVNLMLAFAMLIAALTCFNILNAPRYTRDATLVDGELQIESVPNPRYPSEEKRKVCQILLDIIPAGQMYQLAGRSVPNTKVLPAYALGEFILFAGAGIVLFEKKELK